MRLRLILLLIAVTAVAAPAADKTLTVRDIARIRTVTSATISPDGQAIAYTVSVPRKLFEEDDGPAWSELHVWDETRGAHPFVAGEVNVGQVEWTPDGAGISFLAKRDGDEKRSLYVIPLTGGEARRVLTHETDISEYDWLADGSRVAFRAAEKKDEAEEKLEKKGFNQRVYEEARPYARVWIAAIEGDGKPRMLDLEGSANNLTAAPDGDLLAVSVAPTPLVDHDYMYKRVYIVRTEDGEIEHKIENPGKVGEVHWSPDGRRVAMAAGADQNDPNPGRLYLTNLETRQTTKHFLTAKGDVAGLAWKDAGSLLYLWDEGVETSLRSFDVGSGASAEVIDEAFPAISYSAGSGRAAMVGSTPKHPAELYLLESGASAPKRLTNSNPWLDEYRLATQEVIEYQSRDGLSLQAILIRPLGEEQGKRYPLIVQVHGGPEAHHHNAWMTSYSNLGQVAAATGFAVVYPNYRASTGRGVEFSKLDHGRPAMEEFDDLVDAVHHLSRNMKLVDEERVGVTGGSYGGYATAWCSTALSEHFAAGVMFVGISNRISMAGTSDIPDELYYVHDRKRLWEDWKLFLEQSPVYHVEKARTPLLILHGDSDTRVSPSQSLELYRHLKVLGNVPVRLVFYPGEGHGNARAASRYDFSLRSLRWFQHYLQEDGAGIPPKEVDYGLPQEDEQQ